MKFVISCIVALSVVSSAQGQHKLSADGKEAIPYVKKAAEIAQNVQHASLNNFLAVFVSYRDSDEALKDDDLGPFMKIKQALPAGGRCAVCLFSAKKDAAICVYFDEKNPFGVAAAKSGADGKLGDPGPSYQMVTTEMRVPSGQKLNYTETSITTDYGAWLTAFMITAQ